MYGHIMVPLDGSHTAEIALPTAMEIAKRSGATLHIVRVVSWLHELTDTSTARSPRRYVQRIASGLEAVLPTLTVRTDLLSDAINGVAYGNPPMRAIAEVLDEYALSNNIDLTIITSHGRGGYKRMWLGSVADSMLRLSNASLLVLRAGRPARRAAPIRPSRILVPIDVADQEEEVIARALELGELFDAAYTLLHVSPPMLSFIPAGGVEIMDSVADDAPQAQTCLDRIAATIRDTGHDVETAVVTMPFISSEILAYAKDHDFDLIAVATTGPNWMKRMMLGSVADKVIRGAPVPVLACNIRPLR